MKIVIDARMYGLEHAGIGRYVLNLVNQIEKLDSKNKYYLLLRRKYFKSLRFESGRLKKVLADYPHYSLKEQILLPLQLIKLKPDLVHFPHFNTPLFWQGRRVVTIHDLIKHHSKGRETTTRWQPLYWYKFLVYRFLVWFSVKRATKIIVPSRYWKEELISRYSVPPDKLVVTYEGISSKFKSSIINHQSSIKILKKYHITKPFIIYTGSLYPHKNVEKLVKATLHHHESSRSDEKLSLVIVCARSIFYDRFLKKVKEIRAEKLVNLVGFVPDEDLVVLYHQAEAFVLPTLLEGFGLIGLEAMGAGCPVLASNIPVLKEVYGKAALYFNPRDEKDIAEKIKQVVGNRELKNKLKKFGLSQAEKYSWQKMAQKTLQVYAQA